MKINQLRKVFGRIVFSTPFILYFAIAKGLIEFILFWKSPFFMALNTASMVFSLTLIKAYPLLMSFKMKKKSCINICRDIADLFIVYHLAI